MSEKSLDISVVTPVFNRRKAVTASIQSSLQFLHQCGLEGEIVVVDDASTDGTPEHVEDVFRSQIILGRLSVIRRCHNGGATAAKQTGAESAQGDWLLFMDSDDVFIENCGQAVVATLKEAPSDYPVVFFRCMEIGTGQLIGQWQSETIDLPIRQLIRHGTPGECLPAVRRTALIAEPYDSDLRGFEFLAYARMARHFGPARVSPIIARGYCTDGAGDRLSIRKAIRKRGCLLALGYMRVVKLFWRELGPRVVMTMARIGYHGMNCILVSITKWLYRRDI